MIRLGVVACALLVLPACSAILNFDQCDVDTDCVLGAQPGQMLYCTTDHICVTDVPSDRLCVLSPVSSTSPDAVTIAGLFRRTGPNDVLDTAIEDAVVLAVDEINTIGATRPLRLVLCDTADDPDQAKKALVTAADAFGAVAGVGPTSSGEAIALAAAPDLVVQQHDFLIVSPSATSPSITTIADNGLIWRTAASDELQGDVLAGLVHNVTHVSSAFVSSAYGSGLSDAFSAALARLPSAPMFFPQSFPQGTPGATVAAALAAQNAEIALIVADSDAPVWIPALDIPALGTTRFLLTDGSKAPELFMNGISTELAGRIHGTAPATPNVGSPSATAFEVFQATYMARFGTDPSATAFVANAYDALYCIAIAMGTIPPESRVTGQALAVGMSRLSDKGAQQVRIGPGLFSQGYATLANGGTVDLQGTSGDIDFDSATGDLPHAEIQVWQIDTSTTANGTCTLDSQKNPTCPFQALMNVTP